MALLNGSNEVVMVAALARAQPSKPAFEAAEEIAKRKINWQAAFDLAKRWKVAPAFAKNVQALDSSVVGPVVMESAASVERLERSLAAATALRTGALAKLLSDSGFDVLILKGPHLGHVCYGDVSMRPAADADLLVRGKEVAGIRSLLIEKGFVPCSSDHSDITLLKRGHALEFQAPTLKVELHTHLLSDYLGIDVDPEILFGTASEFSFDSTPLRGLSLPYSFLYLCWHGAKHRWLQLRWLCDVSDFSGRLEANARDEVLSIAAETRSRRLLALALRSAEATVGPFDSPFSDSDLVDPADTSELVAQVTRGLASSGESGREWVPPISRIDWRLPDLIFWSKARDRLRDRVSPFLRLLRQ